MSSEDSSNTEFLRKSLIAVGAILAIPAGLSIIISFWMLWLRWPYDVGLFMGWILFCGIGLFLLFQCRRVMRSSVGADSAMTLWISVSIYFGIIVGIGGFNVISSLRLAAIGELHDWGGDPLGSVVLVLIVSFLSLPVWALVLSIALCFQSKSASRVRG